MKNNQKKLGVTVQNFLPEDFKDHAIFAYFRPFYNGRQWEKSNLRVYIH